MSKESENGPELKKAFLRIGIPIEEMGLGKTPFIIPPDRKPHFSLVAGLQNATDCESSGHYWYFVIREEQAATVAEAIAKVKEWAKVELATTLGK
jgi:hypothetical protein